MVRRILKFSVTSPWMVLLIALVVGAYGYSALRDTPVDAFPDISENQTIVFTEWMGRSPQDVEDQITYPLSTELQGIPGVKEIRGMSGFGFSQIYVVFEDGIDFYWARTRVLERLSSTRDTLPTGVQPQIGPEATALGQIFWYVVEGPGYDLATLRSLQDFYIKFGLQSVDGVAEVASVGGYVRQYQIDIDPNRLKAYGVSLGAVLTAVRLGNIDVGAKTLETNGLEAIVRGLGFIESIEDVENLVVATHDDTPIYIKNVATVQLGPDFRRGALADEHGEKVGGVVAMRYGANPKDVIEGVKARLAELEVGLPEGVRVVPFYDRTQLIDETLATLETALLEELMITVLVVMLFLLHLRTSLIVATTLPLAVLMAFIAMRAMGLGADIMSLTGIAIAIGTVVDMGIIMSENIFSALTREPDRPRDEVVREAAAEVGPAIMTAVATTVMSFLPVFYLTGQSGKLFTPLAWTKTFAMVSAVILAITLVPALCRLFLKEPEGGQHHVLTAISVGAFAGIGGLLGWGLPGAGILDAVHPWVTASGMALLLGMVGLRVQREPMKPIDENPVSRGIVGVYQPVLRWILAHKGVFMIAPTLVVLGGLVSWMGIGTLLSPVYRVLDIEADQVRPLVWLDETFPGLGSEFMPPLDEGSYLAMPSLLAQASLNETLDVMQTMNAEIAEIPEVAQVVGKLGRAETALDPAPIGMMETVVNLEPEHRWRPGITREDILQELKRKSRIIGTTPSWLQPIETRIVMLQSGIRATMALRLRGSPRRPDGTPYTGDAALRIMENAVIAMEDVVREVPGAVDVTALRLGGKPYIELDIDREDIARYGLKVRDVQDVIESAVGGMNLTWSLEGRERYPIRVQYQRELRDEYVDLERILVPTPSGAKIPMSALARIEHKLGPAAIRTEDGQLTAYLMFNAFERDETAVIQDALAAVESWRSTLTTDPIPAGLTLTPTGRYRNKIEADQRLMVILPIVLLVNFFLIFLQFRQFRLTLTIFAAIPVAFGGGFLVLALYPGTIYLTTAVWVGFIALFGVAVDDGVVLGTYLDQVFKNREITTVDDIREAIVEAGSRRIRPMLMTTATTILALLPILWSDGRGSDLMQPMALPLVGGMAFAFVTVFVVPVVYAALLERKL